MQQLNLDLNIFSPDNRNNDKPINVAAVPQRSPFRYPGGKTWFVPYVREWLKSLEYKPSKFIEPFCGGAIVGLNVAFDGFAEQTILVELDKQVAAVWHTIISNKEGSWLAEQIVNFEMSEATLDEVLLAPVQSTKELAFQTILKNRVNRGGILAPGVGRIKAGENGKGLNSRWYPATLAKRILAIGELDVPIKFIEGDGIAIIVKNISDPKTVFFIDPPYTIKGQGKRAGTRLYNHYELDHEEIFRLLKQAAGDFLLTYDNAPEVCELARSYNFDTDLILMKNTHNTNMQELVLGRNLDWFRRNKNLKGVG